MSGIVRKLMGAAQIKRPQISFSFVGSNTVDANTISYPSGTQAGDLLIFFDGASSYIPPAAPPTGWNLIALSTGGSSADRAKVSSSWLVATSSTGSVRSDMTYGITGGARRKILAAFRPSASISNVNVFDVKSEMINSAPSENTILASNSDAPLLCISHARRFGSFGSWTSNMTVIINSGNNHGAGYDIQNSNSSDVFVESPGFADEFSGLQTFYIIAT